MKLSDLTNEQRLELKQAIVRDRNEHIGEGTSYGELADADELVSDEVLEAEYAGTEFVPDDFTSPGYKELALKRAEEIGVYEYRVNGKYMEYWSFYGNEGWYFVRHDLDEGKDVFRGANIPWIDDNVIPAFLKTDDGATKYNYMTG